MIDALDLELTEGGDLTSSEYLVLEAEASDVQVPGVEVADVSRVGQARDVPLAG